jgi:dolichol-phosphate mannosyltransferase
MPELIVLLPARNEEDGIGEVIDRIPIALISEKGFDTRVVVVDGDSSDSTCAIAESKGAELIRQNGSIGKGNGVREALKVIFKNPSSDEAILIMLDADATYSPEDIPRFIDSLESCDVVWGSRMRGKMEKNAMSKTNWLGNWILSMAASTLFLKRTTDLCTGYWGFRMGTLKGLTLTAEGFNLEADLFGSVVKSKVKTQEVPIDYAHREGESTLQWYIDGPRILLMALRRRIIG